jgi:hypothetical protein
MRLERMKVWQWCIVGAMLGCAVASVKLWGGESEPVGLEYAAPAVFEQQMIRLHDPSRKLVAYIDHVVLHPEKDDVPLPGQRAGVTDYIDYTVYYVTGKKNEKGEPLYEVSPHRLLMQLHQPQHRSVLGDISKLSLRQYLDKLKDYTGKLDRAKNPDVLALNYRYAWWETTRGAFALYGTGGVIVVGVLWPALLHFLVVLGFGRPPEEGFDLSGYKPRKQAAAAVPATVLSDDDAERIKRLEEELERKLRDGAGPRVATVAVATAAPVKPLTATAVEPPKEEPKKPAKPKGFGTDQGDYYPTEVHGKDKK